MTHFMIADGFPVSEVDSWAGVVHIKIPNHADCGDTPRGVGAACAAWLFKDARESIVGDRLFWNAVQTGGYTRFHSIVPTVNDVSTLASHYEMFGEIPPDDSKMILKLTGREHFQMISYAQYRATGGVPGR
ncbi:hypothetical protein PQR53_22535 [Paraburkholderia fungorum]|uniref:hypothetical protein n=1 Tax=Paraburkholderia fungorum TaxID=134537 RepID=UPI0038B9C0E1